MASASSSCSVSSEKFFFTVLLPMEVSGELGDALAKTSGSSQITGSRGFVRRSVGRRYRKRAAKSGGPIHSVGPFSFLLAGSRPVPIHNWPCCWDSVQKYAIVENLSPLTEAEFVNPAASLFFHCSPNHGLEEASANFLNCQAGPPI
jgi:hypothetical protein